jgi:hypothetical protein
METNGYGSVQQNFIYKNRRWAGFGLQGLQFANPWSMWKGKTLMEKDLPIQLLGFSDYCFFKKQLL